MTNGSDAYSNSAHIYPMTEEKANCAKFPNFPRRTIGAVGTVFNKRIQVCGGKDPTGVISKNRASN